MNKISIKQWDQLEDRIPSYALVADVDLVVIRNDLTTYKADMAQLTGVAYDGVSLV